MESRRITWAEAEQIFPGIEREWVNMCGQEGDCVPPAGRAWRLEAFDTEKGDTRVSIFEVGSESEYWGQRVWVRFSDGGWTHPYPQPTKLPAVFELDQL